MFMCRSRDCEASDRHGDRPHRDHHHGEHHRSDRERPGPSTSRDLEYGGVIATQPRSSKVKRGVPRRHTVGGSGMRPGYEEVGDCAVLMLCRVSGLLG